MSTKHTEGLKPNKCECSFRIRMVGDGCRYCQPQTYIDMLESIIAEERKEAAVLAAEPQAEPEERNYCTRCGKRNGPPGHIHTCTPPAEPVADHIADSGKMVASNAAQPVKGE